MPGVFNIKIENEIVYKTINIKNSTGRPLKNKLNDKKQLDLYKKHLDSYKLPIIGKFIPPPLTVGDDGSYTMKFISGINLMDILDKKDQLCVGAGWKSKEIKPNNDNSINILKQSYILEHSLNLHKNLSLRGDWFLHNMIYNEQDNIIYNVDLEGFYSYGGNSSMCDLKKHLPNHFSSCRNKLLKNINSNVFSVILWNPVKEYYNEIEKEIKDKYKILFDIPYKIDNLDTFIDKVYELDVRCYKAYLPKKKEVLKKYNQEIRFFMILIDNPHYDKQNVSNAAVKMKEKIRGTYKPKLKNYYKDIIIHVSDNSIEANNIYKLIL